MKKKNLIITILIALLVMFSNVINTEAKVKYKARISDSDGVKLRSEPTTAVNNRLVGVPYNVIVDLLDEVDAGNGCNDKWFKVTYSSYTGYICSTYAEKVANVTDIKVSFDNHSITIPDSYEYEIIENKAIALANEDETVAAYITVLDGKYDDYKTNVDQFLGRVTINNVEVNFNKGDVKTIDGKEFIVVSGTATYQGENVIFEYYITKKDNTENAVAIAIFYENGTEESKRNEVFNKINNTFTTSTTNQTSNAIANMNNDEFENYLNSQGFPESYKVKLRELHRKHPRWIFTGTNTGRTWENAMVEQDEFSSYYGDDSPGRSFLNINPSKVEQGMQGYLSTQPNDYNYYNNTFINHDGYYWYQANSQATAHFMDPRYYLTEYGIFTFQDLTYDRSYQNVELVRQVLGNNHLTQFANYFITAAEQNNTSPIYLAALARQEVGTSSTNICSNGHAGVLSDGVDYTGFYNFYNIGASSSSDPKLKSLQTARANGWDSAEKAIVNGAWKISVNYIQCGQHTTYYQKYNFSPKATKGMWHQYTTNIDSLESQSISTYNSYRNMGVLDLAFKFDIPIFSNMPNETPLPSLGNPNNYLSSLNVNGIPVSGFDGGNTNYTVNIPYTENVSVNGSLVASTASVNGFNTFTMVGDEIVHKVEVRAQNGAVRTYNITIKRAANPNQNTTPAPQPNPEPEQNNNNNNNNEQNNQNNEPKQLNHREIVSKSGYQTDDTYLTGITYNTGVSTIIENLKKYDNTIGVNVKDKNGNSKSSGTVFTGDRVELSTGSETKVLVIVQYGDTNGDGGISAIDLLNVQKIILNRSNLTGAFLKAADTNRDGKVSAIDLLNVQKHILGKLVISQN